MKALTLRILMFVFLFGHAYHSKAHVALDYPQGGETFIVGQTIVIEWHIVAPHITLNWDLFFSVDGGETWDTLQMDIPTSQLSYEWEVPDSITTQARIQVFQDNEGQNYLDNSMDFTIAPNTSPPTLDAPATDTLIECSIANQQTAIEAWLSNHGGAYATNYCSELVWSHDYPGISNECGATGSAAVTFTATDECGQITTNATLTIVDTSPPMIDLAATDMTVESNAQGNIPELNAWLNSHGGAQATDVCGLVFWTNNYTTLSNACGTTGSATVIFTATDQCGNSNTTTAVFTIQDHASPTLHTAAQSKTIACDAVNQENEIQQWLSNHGGALATDIGGEVIWSHDYTGLSDGCGSTGSAAVIFTASDECGNSTTTTAVFTIEDLSPPAISLPSQDAMLECSSNHQNAIQLWLDSKGGAQASDACSEVIWSNNYSGLSDGCGVTGSANVIFTATDQCGNSNTSSATVTIRDTVAPVIDIEAQDTTIICGSIDQPTIILSWLNRQGGASASDLCGNLVWSNNFPALSDTCGTVGSHTVVFTATDECGNVISTQAVLTIMDSLVTSVADPHELNFTIYPNPASDVLHVSLDNDNVGQIYLRLTDAFGKLHWSGSHISNEIRIPVSHYPRGVYILEFRTSKGRYARTVVIP
ncbi:MAG: T9SS type A sorting domain-containing protein [Saprospiraceae bacterium]|nr:T9SS type A sorting domain-containing protein [Candidatus Opimibacter skivensis]